VRLSTVRVLKVASVTRPHRRPLAASNACDIHVASLRPCARSSSLPRDASSPSTDASCSANSCSHAHTRAPSAVSAPAASADCSCRITLATGFSFVMWREP
jgi:hypothetical protein